MKKLLIIAMIAVTTLIVSGCTQPQSNAKQNSTNITQSDNKTATADTYQSQNKLITEQEAKDIALEHAKLDQNSVQRLTAHYDYDDGIETYEVEFFSGKYEYDYEIDAVSGEIISFDKEYD